MIFEREPGLAASRAGSAARRYEAALKLSEIRDFIIDGSCAAATEFIDLAIEQLIEQDD